MWTTNISFTNFLEKVFISIHYFNLGIKINMVNVEDYLMFTFISFWVNKYDKRAMTL